MYQSWCKDPESLRISDTPRSVGSKLVVLEDKEGDDIPITPITRLKKFGRKTLLYKDYIKTEDYAKT